MFQKKWQIIVICMAVTIIIAASPALCQEKVFKWRMATAYTTGQPLYKEVPVYFSELVKKMSNGRGKKSPRCRYSNRFYRLTGAP